MKSIPFPKDNWSGEHSVVKINEETNEFALKHMTDKFMLKRVAAEDFETIYEVFLVEKNSQLKLGTVYHNYVNERAEAIGNSGVERDHRGEYSYFVAAAKLICSIL